MVQSYRFVLLKIFFASIPEKNKLMNWSNLDNKKKLFTK